MARPRNVAELSCYAKAVQGYDGRAISGRQPWRAWMDYHFRQDSSSEVDFQDVTNEMLEDWQKASASPFPSPEESVCSESGYDKKYKYHIVYFNKPCAFQHELSMGLSYVCERPVNADRGKQRWTHP